jgi:hypothetical protein
MTTLTEKFDALETQLEAADAAMQVDLNAMRAQLELVNLALETLTTMAQPIRATCCRH